MDEFIRIENLRTTDQTEDDFYYIALVNGYRKGDAIWDGLTHSGIYLGKLDNIEIAETYFIACFKSMYLNRYGDKIGHYFSEEHSGVESAYHLTEKESLSKPYLKQKKGGNAETWFKPELRPLLITNDRRLNFKFRGVLSLDEFKVFCNFYNYNSLSAVDKNIASTGQSFLGGLGIDTFEHLKKLVNGEGNAAYQYTKIGQFIEEESGNSYEYEEDSGWRLDKKFYVNEDIKKRSQQF